MRYLMSVAALMLSVFFAFPPQITAAPLKRINQEFAKSAVQPINNKKQAPEPPKLGEPKADVPNITPADNEVGMTPKPSVKIGYGPTDIVMLQGFHWFADNYWYHPTNGWWGVLEQSAAKVKKSGFGMIWFPPAANGSYYPNQWYNLNGQWGTDVYLKRAITAMKSKGIYVIADIILNHRNGLFDWADFRNPDWPTDVIVKNDEWPGEPKSPNYDEGQGDHGCRDLDHKHPLVQKDSIKYLKWMRNKMGFDGWRYDMVKGFDARHIKNYNDQSGPVFSVGEFYDTNRQELANWVDGTGATSTVFDFTTRYNLVDATENDNYGILNDGGKPSGFVGWWPEKAVTFVDNHDTAPRDVNFMPNAPENYRKSRLIGYAYILTHPGIPCVFWPNIYDWGKDTQNKIEKLISVRKEAGITSTSKIEIVRAEKGLYIAKVFGDKKTVVVKLGSNMWMPFNPIDEGFKKETDGKDYAVWSK